MFAIVQTSFYTLQTFEKLHYNVVFMKKLEKPRPRRYDRSNAIAHWDIKDHNLSRAPFDTHKFHLLALFHLENSNFSRKTQFSPSFSNFSPTKRRAGVQLITGFSCVGDCASIPYTIF